MFNRRNWLKSLTAGCFGFVMGEKTKEEKPLLKATEKCHLDAGNPDYVKAVVNHVVSNIEDLAFIIITPRCSCVIPALNYIKINSVMLKSLFKNILEGLERGYEYDELILEDWVVLDVAGHCRATNSWMLVLYQLETARRPEEEKIIGSEDEEVIQVHCEEARFLLSGLIEKVRLIPNDFYSHEIADRLNAVRSSLL